MIIVMVNMNSDDACYDDDSCCRCICVCVCILDNQSMYVCGFFINIVCVAVTDITDVPKSP